MAPGSLIPRLTDIVEAIDRVQDVMGDMPLDQFETDWRAQWLVERGVEIISEASRHLTGDLKARHPDIFPLGLIQTFPGGSSQKGFHHEEHGEPRRRTKEESW